MASQGSSHTATGSGAAHDDGSNGNGSGVGFKVYGSVFKTDPRYEFLNPLGKGSYGIVCAARDRETGQRIAIKKVCPMAKRSVDAKHTLREVLLLQLLGKHPNIISVHNLSTNLKDDELYIIMDLMDTDMHRVIQSSQALSESHVKYFLHQLLRGVKYLHDNGVLHRDLKPGNLLLTKTCQLKIADFGLARKTVRSTSGTSGIAGVERPRSAPAMSHGASSSSSSSASRDRAPMTEHVVTRWYRAPELMLQPDGFYDESVDMWSVGCIFAEILGRKALFPGKNFLHQLTLIFDVIGTPPAEATARIKSSQAQRFLKSLGKKPRVPFRTIFPAASDEALDLLERLLEFDPERRISAQEALAHPFMQAVERKYKGVDPHPSARVDFSFDTKKLTKLDLRALIIKEVESFRRSVAHTAAIDADVTAEIATASSAMGSSLSKTVTTHTSEREMSTKHRPASASAIATSTSRVMCGSAGISMVHSTMRQRLDTESVTKNEGTSSSSRPLSAAATTTTTSHASATIGSNRQRIRVATKPPVPKQPLAPSIGLAAADPHGGLVRVVTAQDTTCLLASLVDTKQAASEPQDDDVSASSADKPDPIESARLQVGPTIAASVATVATTQKGAFSLRENQRDPVQSAATTAFSTFEQRCKVLMAAPPANDKDTWAAPVASLCVTKAVAAPSARPEMSPAPSSPAPKSPASSSSSSSSSSSDLDAEPHHRVFKREGGQLTERTGMSESLRPGPARRRVASAGATRSKPTASTTVASTQKPQSKPGTVHAAYVGSTTSLIRAQRSNNGKSLADAADQMVATMTARPRETGEYQDPRVREARDESSLEGAEPVLRPQRSTTQLNQLEPTAKKPMRKLTVPKSPKFSVMSWQKKKEMRPHRVASTTTTVDPVGGYVVARR